MYPHSFLWYYFWIAPHVLQIPIAVILIRRGLHREFPCFLAYTIFQIFSNAVLFILDHAASVTWYQYRWAEWVSDVISIVLRFAIIQEIVLVVFRFYPALKQLGALAYRSSIAILVLISLGIAFHAPGADYAPGVMAGLVVLNRAIAIVQLGLLLFLFLFSSYFGLSWRSYVFGIAAGLGIFSAVQLATVAIRAQVHVESRLFLDFLPTVTYHVCVLIWICYLLLPEKIQLPVLSVPAHDLETWTEELERILQR